MVEYNSASASLITCCIDPDALRDLTNVQREVVLLLMARAAERSYRRGFQQGAHIALNRKQDLPEGLADWRYRPSTDESPWGDNRYHTERSVDRLLIENDGLRSMGFFAPPKDVSLFDVVMGRHIAGLAEKLGRAIHDGDDYDQRKIIDEAFLLGHNLAAEGGLIAMVRTYEAAEQLHPDDYDLGMLAIADTWQGIAGWTLQREAA